MLKSRFRKLLVCLITILMVIGTISLKQKTVQAIDDKIFIGVLKVQKCFYDDFHKLLKEDGTSDRSCALCH